MNYDLVSNVFKFFLGDVFKFGMYICDVLLFSGFLKFDNLEVVIDCSDKSVFFLFLISVLNFRKDVEKMFWCIVELEG